MFVTKIVKKRWTTGKDYQLNFLWSLGKYDALITLFKFIKYLFAFMNDKKSENYTNKYFINTKKVLVEFMLVALSCFSKYC